MFGCAERRSRSRASPPATTRTAAASWGNGLGTIRDLHELGFRTSFWTRSSADGRFVGNGGGNGSRRDHHGPADRPRHRASRPRYDPGLFPDNSGFIFQGATGGAGICAQSVLERRRPHRLQRGRVHHRARHQPLPARRARRGRRRLLHHQQPVHERLRPRVTKDPVGRSFNATSTMKFTPMIFNGTHLPAAARRSSSTRPTRATRCCRRPPSSS